MIHLKSLVFPRTRRDKEEGSGQIVGRTLVALLDSCEYVVTLRICDKYQNLMNLINCSFLRMSNFYSNGRPVL